MGRPPGLFGVLSMIGGTAPTSTAWLTREVPKAADIADYSPPPVEWPDEDRVVEVEHFNELGQVVRVVVHVVALP